MPTFTPTRQKLTIVVSDALADRYAKPGSSIESEMALRLAKCVDYTATNPIYITDEQRNMLSQIAGRLIATPDDLLTWAHNISTLKVQGVEVTLDQRLLSRIEGRRFGQSLASTIKRETIEGLERSVGLR